MIDGILKSNAGLLALKSPAVPRKGILIYGRAEIPDPLIIPPAQLEKTPNYPELVFPTFK